MRLLFALLISGVMTVSGLAVVSALDGAVAGESSTPTYVHPGRTDRSGCHTCRTNCSRWGLRSGQRHCHRPRRNEQARFSVLLVTEQTVGLV